METSNQRRTSTKFGKKVSNIAEMLLFAIIVAFLTGVPLGLIGAIDAAFSAALGAFLAGLTVKRDKQEKREN